MKDVRTGKLHTHKQHYESSTYNTVSLAYIQTYESQQPPNTTQVLRAVRKK